VIFVYDGPLKGEGAAWTYSRQELLRRSHEIEKRVRVFFGHYAFDPELLLDSQCRGLGFVRDPKARIVSWQRYIRSNGPSLPHTLMAGVSDELRGGASMRDVWRKFGGIRELDNGIVRMFANARGPAGIVGEADLEQAIQNVERYFDFVGHVDWFESSMQRIAEILGRPYQAVTRQNESPGGRSESWSADAEEVAWLCERTEFDQRFVDWVAQRYPDPAAKV